jgi:hypothetical protein
MRNDPLPPSPDLLTVEQFAERLQVSRTTVFGWLKTGALAERVHYFRLGRVLRFRWHDDLFFNSQPKANGAAALPCPSLPVNPAALDSQRGEAPVNSPPLLPETAADADDLSPPALKRQPRPRNQPGINLDY